MLQHKILEFLRAYEPSCKDRLFYFQNIHATFMLIMGVSQRHFTEELSKTTMHLFLKTMANRHNNREKKLEIPV